MLTLVLGGAASGKSEYAESLVLKTALPRYYLATMQVWDAECAARVEKHRQMRAKSSLRPWSARCISTPSGSPRGAPPCWKTSVT